MTQPLSTESACKRGSLIKHAGRAHCRAAFSLFSFCGAFSDRAQLRRRPAGGDPHAAGFANRSQPQASQLQRRAHFLVQSTAALVLVLP